jgi:hypothetical protein
VAPTSAWRIARLNGCTALGLPVAEAAGQVRPG